MAKYIVELVLAGLLVAGILVAVYAFGEERGYGWTMEERGETQHDGVYR